jgi:acyl dehydratase
MRVPTSDQRLVFIDQAQIDAFAATTEDRQWIHVDPARSATGPFRGTIAHGYLTLSLVSKVSPRAGRGS